MWSIGKVGAVGSSGPTGISPSISVRPASDSARLHSHPSIANCAKLNRQTPGVERLATRRKQTPPICSNRQKIQFCFDENQPFKTFLSGAGIACMQTVNAFLTGLPRATFAKGSGSHSKMDVTRSKQTSGTYLTETRIARLLARAAAAAILVLLLLQPVAAFAAAPPIHRQAAAPVLDTTVCEITAHPLDFEGKMVRVKARIVTLFKSRVLEDATQPCSRVMRLTYSTEPAPASSFVPGPDTPAKDLPRPTVVDDDQFKLFQKYLTARMYPTSEGAPCSPCDRYEITATLTGMVNFPVSAKPDSDRRNPRERLFFLQSLADVTPRDISATYDPKKFSTEPLAFSRGFVSGRLLGPDGKPLPQTDVQIVSTESVPASIKGTHQLTDDQGQFNFEVAPGQYVVAINVYTGPSKDLPYGTTYLPGTTNVISATMIQVQAGQHVEHLTLQLSAAQRLHERKFSGKVEWPDGRAATDVAVWLNEDEHHQLLMKGPASRTDAAGDFTLIGFEGRDYFLHASVNLAGKPVCAKKLRLNSTAPPDAIDLKLSVGGQIPCLKQ